MRMRSSWPLVILLATCGLVSGAGAAGAKSQQGVRLALVGASVQRIEICGSPRRASVAEEGERVVARVAAARRRPASLTLERCENGRWRRLRRERMGTHGPSRRLRRYRGRIDTGEVGDYRIRVLVAGQRRRRAPRGRAAYLRVGVGEIVDVPVSFGVKNLNRSEAPCLTGTDGKDYLARGHLVGPRSLLSDTRARSITVYLHGGIMGEELWHFSGYPGYNHLRQMARLGHVSVSFSQLGYDPSGIPHGYETCLGADADVAHQVIAKLRSGDYRTPRGGSPSFDRVALAGLSGGALRANVEAFSFADIDALVSLGTALVPSPTTALFLAELAPGCLPPDGGPHHPAGPGGYADYEGERAAVRRRKDDVFFYNADPAVEEAVFRGVEQDPCGVFAAGVQTLAAIAVHQPEIRVPVLIMSGDHDGAAPSMTPREQALHYTGSDDVTASEIANSGHLLMFQRTAPLFRRMLSEWLRERGF
jgi:pimeloyl-ACP methyl ester carboxylesterase